MGVGFCLRPRPSSSIRALVFLVLGDVTPSWSNLTRGSAGIGFRRAADPSTSAGRGLGRAPELQLEIGLDLGSEEEEWAGLGLGLGVDVDDEDRGVRTGLGLCVAVLL